MNVGATIKTSAQAAEAMHPGVGALDDPADLAESCAVRLATPGNGGWDHRSVQRLAILVVVVTTVGIHALGLVQRPAASTGNARDRRDQRKKLGDVVAIGAGQDDGERRTVGIGGEVVLGAWARTIRGARSCF